MFEELEEKLEILQIMIETLGEKQGLHFVKEYPIYFSYWEKEKDKESKL